MNHEKEMMHNEKLNSSTYCSYQFMNTQQNLITLFKKADIHD